MTKSVYKVVFIGFLTSCVCTFIKSISSVGTSGGNNRACIPIMSARCGNSLGGSCLTNGTGKRLDTGGRIGCRGRYGSLIPRMYSRRRYFFLFYSAALTLKNSLALFRTGRSNAALGIIYIRMRAYLRVRFNLPDISFSAPARLTRHSFDFHLYFRSPYVYLVKNNLFKISCINDFGFINLISVHIVKNKLDVYNVVRIGSDISVPRK